VYGKEIKIVYSPRHASNFKNQSEREKMLKFWGDCTGLIPRVSPDNHYRVIIQFDPLIDEEKQT